MSKPRGIVIDDHAHQQETGGGFRSGRCNKCGEPNRAHLSFGESAAAKLGGDPLDYVHPIRTEESS